jgi:hypothetical protein
MRRSSRLQTVLVLALGAVMAALAYVNWWVLQLEPDSAPIAERPVLASLTSTAVEEVRPIDDRSVSDFDEIVRRPVFTASRRPFVAPEPNVREPVRLLPPPDLKLLGVTIDASRKQALLRTAQQPQGRWISEGESVEGWHLRSVRDDAAIIASGQQTHELRLYPTLGRSNGNQK